jgi:hypothetical protein
MQTWGISGPQFLFIYVVLVGLTALIVAAAQRRVIAAPSRMGEVPELDPYEVAYLNGGRLLRARPRRRIFCGPDTSTSRRENQSRYG